MHTPLHNFPFCCPLWWTALYFLRKAWRAQPLPHQPTHRSILESYKLENQFHTPPNNTCSLPARRSNTQLSAKAPPASADWSFHRPNPKRRGRVLPGTSTSVPDQNHGPPRSACGVQNCNTLPPCVLTLGHELSPCITDPNSKTGIRLESKGHLYLSRDGWETSSPASLPGTSRGESPDVKCHTCVRLFLARLLTSLLHNNKKCILCPKKQNLLPFKNGNLERHLLLALLGSLDLK